MILKTLLKKISCISLGNNIFKYWGKYQKMGQNFFPDF